MKKQNDELVLMRLKDDDQKALEELFQQYYYSLCFFAKSFVKSADWADEIVSDVFLNIWQKRKSLDIHQNFKAYLFAATKNQAINHLNKNKLIFDELDPMGHHATNAAEISAETSLNYAETQQEIDALIECLPQQRRMIFKLNRLEGFRYKEIAEILHISVNTVQKQMTEAVKYMSQYKSKFVTSNSFSLVYLFLFFSL